MYAVHWAVGRPGMGAASHAPRKSTFRSTFVLLRRFTISLLRFSTCTDFTWRAEEERGVGRWEVGREGWKEREREAKHEWQQGQGKGEVGTVA